MTNISAIWNNHTTIRIGFRLATIRIGFRLGFRLGYAMSNHTTVFQGLGFGVEGEGSIDNTLERAIVGGRQGLEVIR